MRRAAQIWDRSPRSLAARVSDQSNALALLQQASQEPAVIASAAEALNVFDFEPAAKAKIPVAHWGYLMTGTDDDGTIRANREGFTRYDLRVRRLVDVGTIDASVRLLGVKWETPIVINPIGSQKRVSSGGRDRRGPGREGEGPPEVLSTVATTSIEDVIAARGAAGVVSSSITGRIGTRRSRC